MAMQNNLFNPLQRNKINIQSIDCEPKVSQTATKANINSVHLQYQQNMVNTASPQELTLMLYNGMIKFLNLAIQGVEEKSIQKANNNIIRAQDILTEFMSTLDMDYEVSQGLMALYDYMFRRLTEANIKKDKAIIEEVLGFAEELRDTWAQAMKLAKQQQVVNK